MANLVKIAKRQAWVIRQNARDRAKDRAKAKNDRKRDERNRVISSQAITDAKIAKAAGPSICDNPQDQSHIATWMRAQRDRMEKRSD